MDARTHTVYTGRDSFSTKLLSAHFWENKIKKWKVSQKFGSLSKYNGRAQEKRVRAGTRWTQQNNKIVEIIGSAKIVSFLK